MYNATAETAVSLPSLPFTLCSLAVGLLVTFRTNTSYKRFWEARNAWGQLINSSRDLARQVSVYAEPEAPGRRRMARLLRAFPVALNFHLTTNGGHHDIQCRHSDIEAVCRAELEAELRQVFPDASDVDYQAILKAHFHDSMPLVILKAMAETLRDLPNVDSFTLLEMDKHLTRMTGVLGGCEKILKTPIPTKYSRHTSRFVTLWCSLLPFALWPLTGMATAPATLFITYGLLGIEDIGVQIEEPFDVLPLRAYCNSIHASVKTLM